MLTNLNERRACTKRNACTALACTHGEIVTVEKSLIVKIATHNVRGLSNRTKQTCALNDLANYDLDICCLQETKVREEIDYEEDENKSRIILIPGRDKEIGRHYGMGFVLNKMWSNKLKTYEYISDRIAKAEFELSNKRRLVVINVYAPTQARADANETEIEAFYSDLQVQVKMHDKKDTITVIAGDFNAKVGQRIDGEECLGQFTRGRRNNNGQRLVEFCEENNLAVSNSLFKHRASHTTTWESTRELEHDDGTRKVVRIFNQIDYILV